MDFRHLEYLQEKYLGPERYLDEAITSEKGKAKAAEMIAKRTTPSGRAKPGRGANVAQIRHIIRSEREGLSGTPSNRKTAGSNWPKSYSGMGGTGNKAKRRAAELNKEQVDIYDIILSHLLDEGYAETPEAAETIMVHMSEDWRESIVYEFVELNEGVRSTLKKIFGKNKKTKEDQPESRGAYLRRKYNVGPEKSDTSAKRQIIDRSRARAERDERDYGDSRYSKSVAQKSREAYNRYLKAGYSKYGATHTAGSAPKQGRGNKARRRTENR